MNSAMRLCRCLACLWLLSPVAACGYKDDLYRPPPEEPAAKQERGG